MAPTMKNRTTACMTLDIILQLLSDDEVAQVSSANQAPRLSVGDEYLDLEQLEDGVRRLDGSAMPRGSVLPRKTGHADTWTQILTQMVGRPRA